MKEIHLTQGKVALVDDDAFEELSQVKWCAHKIGNTFYAERGMFVDRRVVGIKMHHEIIGKPPKGMVNDHKDGNGLNNQRNNLRHVTRRQNCQNLKNSTKLSCFPGVDWHKHSKLWRSRIRIGNKRNLLGYFKTEIEAFVAYRQAVENLGEAVIGND